MKKRKLRQLQEFLRRYDENPIPGTELHMDTIKSTTYCYFTRDRVTYLCPIGMAIEYGIAPKGLKFYGRKSHCSPSIGPSFTKNWIDISYPGAMGNSFEEVVAKAYGITKKQARFAFCRESGMSKETARDIAARIDKVLNNENVDEEIRKRPQVYGGER